MKGKFSGTSKRCQVLNVTVADANERTRFAFAELSQTS